MACFVCPLPSRGDCYYVIVCLNRKYSNKFAVLFFKLSNKKSIRRKFVIPSTKFLFYYALLFDDSNVNTDSKNLTTTNLWCRSALVCLFFFKSDIDDAKNSRNSISDGSQKRENDKFEKFSRYILIKLTPAYLPENNDLQRRTCIRGLTRWDEGSRGGKQRNNGNRKRILRQFRKWYRCCWGKVWNEFIYYAICFSLISEMIAFGDEECPENWVLSSNSYSR